MTRTLRPRKSRPNYAIEQASDKEKDEREDLASNVLTNSGSGEENGEDTSSANEADNEVVVPVKKLKAAKPPQRRNAQSKGLSGRQQYALPSSDHRQHPPPLYLDSRKIERLASPPSQFGTQSTLPTNDCLSDKVIFERYWKASAYNVGHGPLWELMEDRSWWKESLLVRTGDVETEATRRPRVYQSVEVTQNPKVLSQRDAADFLPGNFSPAPSLKCYFGPSYQQSLRELRLFDAIELQSASVFYAGGPVLGMDWCPVFAEDSKYRLYRHYLALSPCHDNPGSKSITLHNNDPSPSCIQLWSFSPKAEINAMDHDGQGQSTNEAGVSVRCELVLCISCGPATVLKWCPLPSNDPWSSKIDGHIRKLGLLAGVFADGAISIFIVPDPEDLPSQDAETPIYVLSSPMIRIELEESSFTCIDWMNSDMLVAGSGNGNISSYSIKSAVENNQQADLIPYHHYSLHQSAIRSIQSIRVPRISVDGQVKRHENPTIIASGGYDGCIVLTDMRDGTGNVITRTRGIVMDMMYSPHCQGVVSTDLENVAKVFSIVPSMLGRGHQILEAEGPVCSLATSDYHPHLALGSADGSLSVANLLRHIRRGGSIPPIFYKIYQLDFNRRTGEYRMLDHFLPKEIPEKSGGTKTSKDTVPVLGSWPSEVAVTKATWNSGCGLSKAPLLASATASGLCRVDYLLGSFPNKKVPYGGIEHVKKELGA